MTSATSRRLASAAIALAAVLILPSTASAAELLNTTVAASQAKDQACHTGLRAGQPGVVTREAVAPAQGIVYARLTAASGDWDLAVYDKATGAPLAAAAGFDATELAEGVVGAGARTVVVQGCRRTGTADRAQLTLHNVALPEASAEDRKASMVEVTTPTPAAKNRLNALDLDVTEHGGEDFVEVVLYGDKDEAKLRNAGFDWKVSVPDVVAQARENAAANRRFSSRAAASALPSGRDQYRRLADFENELKELVQQNPGLVKPITLKFKTNEGRDVNGIEITQNVNDLGDGKPVFFNMGIHHAREWPSGEHAMEFAYELIRGYGKNERITGLVNRTRTIIVPVINPDGYNVSREAPIAIDQAGLAFDTNNDQIPDPLNLGVGGLDLGYTASILGDPAGAYKRKNCRLVDGQEQPEPICRAPQFRQVGTDPNRNYGGLWGGAGATFLPSGETYRGAGPFSEPETRNVRDLVSNRQVTTLITNHTFSNLVLRPPGVRAQGPPPDEPVYADLGRRMTEQNGYANNPSYQLYDTTGGTEDWTYYASGGLGFTFEIGPDQFHPPFEQVVKEYEGSGNFAGKGNREAYLIALENTADAAKHSIIAGKAPDEAVLKIDKSFKTDTSPVRLVTGPGVLASEPDDNAPTGPKQTFDDQLLSTFDPKGGAFEWHVNPSTRPAVDTREFPGGVGDKPTRSDAYSGEGGSQEDKDVEFTITPEDATTLLDIKLDAQLNDDYDLELYFKEGEKLTEVGSSGNPPLAPGDPADPTGADERIIVEKPATGTYVLRIINFAAVGPYSGSIDRFQTGPNKVVVGQRESWNLRCETPGGKLLQEQKVFVKRGAKFDAGTVCGPDAARIIALERSKRSAAKVCASASGFSSTSARPRGRGVRFDFRRLTANPVTVDVFQASSGRRIFGERRVARFTGRTRAFDWSGSTQTRTAVRDGVFFARFRIKGVKRTDVRRITLVRTRGRFRVAPQFYRPDSCGLLSSAKLERPSFGGRSGRALNIAFRVSRRANATITIRRGSKVVRTIRTRGRAARRTHRFRVGANQLRARGTYRVTIAVVSGSRRARTTLTARRL